MTDLEMEMLSTLKSAAAFLSNEDGAGFRTQDMSGDHFYRLADLLEMRIRAVIAKAGPSKAHSLSNVTRTCPVPACKVMGECNARAIGMPEYCQSQAQDDQAAIAEIMAMSDAEIIATSEPDAADRVQQAFERAKEDVLLRVRRYPSPSLETTHER